MVAQQTADCKRSPAVTRWCQSWPQAPFQAACWAPSTPRIADMRLFEYTIIEMDDALRQFKSEIFQGLAHPTRIAIVELLRDQELSAGKLIEKLGIEQANASQHLAVLRAKQIVVSRKVGNQVYYSIRDHALIEVLEILRRYFYSQLSTTVNMLKQAAREEPKARARAHR
jgi:DNA-binding transcriptional ArsR family regulator